MTAVGEADELLIVLHFFGGEEVEEGGEHTLIIYFSGQFILQQWNRQLIRVRRLSWLQNEGGITDQKSQNKIFANCYTWSNHYLQKCSPLKLLKYCLSKTGNKMMEVTLEQQVQDKRLVTLLIDSNFSCGLFCDKFQGTKDQKDHAIRAFYRLQQFYQDLLTFRVGYAMRTRSQSRYKPIFQELVRMNPNFPKYFYRKIVDPNWRPEPNLIFNVIRERQKQVRNVKKVFEKCANFIQKIKTTLVSCICQD